MKSRIVLCLTLLFTMLVWNTEVAAQCRGDIRMMGNVPLELRILLCNIDVVERVFGDREESTLKIHVTPGMAALFFSHDPEVQSLGMDVLDIWNGYLGADDRIAFVDFYNAPGGGAMGKMTYDIEGSEYLAQALIGANGERQFFFWVG